MANVLKPKRRTVDNTAPTTGDLVDGELAVNSLAQTIYMRVGGSIIPVANYGTAVGGAFADAFDTSPFTYYNGSGGANNIDVNTLTAGTKVLVNAGGGNTNYPAAGGFWYIETVRAFTGTSVIQRAWRYNSSGLDGFAYRNYNGTTWSTWNQAWDKNTSRLLADFNNATSASRTHFQTINTNQNTVVGAIPNGTGTIASYRVSNASDPDNASCGEIRALPGSVDINSAKIGTGTVLDITFSFSSVVKATLYAADGLFEAPYFSAKGTQAGVLFWDRANPTQRWIQYSTGNILRLYWAATAVDKFTFDSSGNFVADGSVTVENTLLAGYKNLVTGGANTFVLGKVNKMTVGATLNTGFAADSTYLAYNNSGVAIVLTAGAGLTLRLGGTTSTGNRTLAPRGMATIWCISTTEYVVWGDVT